MPKKKKAFTVKELHEFQGMRNRLEQLGSIREEIQRQIENLRTKVDELNAEEEELSSKLARDFSELQNEEGLFATSETDAASSTPLIDSTKYVKSEKKGPLLDSILRNYQQLNPKAKTISYSEVKRTLEERYGIQCRSIANFFVDQLPNYETVGGNRNKSIVLPKR